MMQLRRRTFVVTLAVAVIGGMALGAYAAGGGDRIVRPVAAPLVDAPILPVQMPLPSGSFAKVADLVKDGGMRPIDTGPLSRARQIEGMQFLHIVTQGGLGTNWASTIKILS